MSAADGVAFKWSLPGVQAPHDMAVVAAPLRLAEADRPVAFLIAETRASGSKLHKFILLPDGKSYIRVVTGCWTQSAKFSNFAECHADIKS